MPVTLESLAQQLCQGLHTDNLFSLIQDCDRLIGAGQGSLPLFVLRSCLGVLLERKQERPSDAAVVAGPDAEFSRIAGTLLASLAEGKSGPESWPVLERLVRHTTLLPPHYPSGHR